MRKFYALCWCLAGCLAIYFGYQYTQVQQINDKVDGLQEDQRKLDVLLDEDSGTSESPDKESGLGVSENPDDEPQPDVNDNQDDCDDGGG